MPGHVCKAGNRTPRIIIINISHRNAIRKECYPSCRQWTSHCGCRNGSFSLTSIALTESKMISTANLWALCLRRRTLSVTLTFEPRKPDQFVSLLNSCVIFGSNSFSGSVSIEFTIAYLHGCHSVIFDHMILKKLFSSFLSREEYLR